MPQLSTDNLFRDEENLIDNEVISWYLWRGLLLYADASLLTSFSKLLAVTGPFFPSLEYRLSYNLIYL